MLAENESDESELTFSPATSSEMNISGSALLDFTPLLQATISLYSTTIDTMQKWTLLVSLCASVLLPSACTTQLKKDRWEHDGYRLQVEMLEGTNWVQLELEAIIDTPPWRVWNVFLDTDRVYDLFERLELVETRFDQKKGVHHRTVRAIAPWYGPNQEISTETTVDWSKLEYVERHVVSPFKYGLVRNLILPYGDGSKTYLKMTSVAEPPWWMPTGEVIAGLYDSYVGFVPKLRIRVLEPEYSKPDPRFPWSDLRKLAIKPVGSKEETVVTQNDLLDHDDAKVALQNLIAYGAAETDAVVATISTRLLADYLRRAANLKIVTTEDLEMMASYLGDNWTLICDSEDKCERRIAKLADADYVLSGRLNRGVNEYHLQFSLFDPDSSEVVWGFQRSTSLDLDRVRSAIIDATKEIHSIGLRRKSAQ